MTVPAVHCVFPLLYMLIVRCLRLPSNDICKLFTSHTGLGICNLYSVAVDYIFLRCVMPKVISIIYIAITVVMLSTADTVVIIIIMVNFKLSSA